MSGSDYSMLGRARALCAFLGKIAYPTEPLPKDSSMIFKSGSRWNLVMAALLCSSVRLPSMRVYCIPRLVRVAASASNVVVQQEKTRLGVMSKDTTRSRPSHLPLYRFFITVKGPVKLE